MSSWSRSLNTAAAAALAVLVAPGRALAAPAPVVLAACGDSRVELAPGAAGKPTTVHAVIVIGANRWSFAANVGLARVGATTRTLTVEGLHTEDGKPAPRGKATAPSALFIDILVDDKKVILRHASEGGDDPAYAVDLDGCKLDGDPALAALEPPPVDPPGCSAAVVRGAYRTQVMRTGKLAEADADREAQALCTDHQQTIEARTRVEHALSDRAARDRLAARGAALLKVEDNRLKAWSKLDSCVGADPSKANGMVALHDGEAKLRACYGKLAAKR